jgi:hypothetical protein
MSEKAGGAGRGKGKPKGKGGRGSGNRMVIDNEEEMAIRDQQIEAGREARAKRRAEADEDEEENEEVASSFLKQGNAFGNADWLVYCVRRRLFRLQYSSGQRSWRPIPILILLLKARQRVEGRGGRVRD